MIIVVLVQYIFASFCQLMLAEDGEDQVPLNRVGSSTESSPKSKMARKQQITGKPSYSNKMVVGLLSAMAILLYLMLHTAGHGIAGEENIFAPTPPEVAAHGSVVCDHRLAR